MMAGAKLATGSDMSAKGHSEARSMNGTGEAPAPADAAR
jgi:hypothetical protein